MSAPDAIGDGHIDTAVAAFDRVLAAKPHRDGEAFTEATKAVCAYRDGLRARMRQSIDAVAVDAVAIGAVAADVEAGGAEADRRRLKSANLAITLLISGHYPLGDTPWPALEGLRAQLDGLRVGARG